MKQMWNVESCNVKISCILNLLTKGFRQTYPVVMKMTLQVSHRCCLIINFTNINWLGWLEIVILCGLWFGWQSYRIFENRETILFLRIRNAMW